MVWIVATISARPNREQMRGRWVEFLDRLEERLTAVGRTRPSVTSADVIALRDAIFAISNEASGRVIRRLTAEHALTDEVRAEANKSFNFATALDPMFPANFTEEVAQILCFGAFVVAQKLVLYRVLEDAGPRRAEPFSLDALSLPIGSTDPQAIKAMLDRAFALAIKRSGDYATAFLPEPFIDLVFTDPEGALEAKECWVGQVWHRLLEAVIQASWLSISQHIVGLLYEVIVDERFRHQLGQFYTPEDVVDVLTAFSARAASGFLRSPPGSGNTLGNPRHSWATDCATGIRCRYRQPALYLLQAHHEPRHDLERSGERYRSRSSEVQRQE
jgi:hypothetical protein